jgi:hypothetical protein
MCSEQNGTKTNTAVLGAAVSFVPLLMGIGRFPFGLIRWTPVALLENNVADVLGLP